MQSQADALSGQYHAHQMHSQASATPTKLPVEHMTSAWFKSPSRDLLIGRAQVHASLLNLLQCLWHTG